MSGVANESAWARAESLGAVVRRWPAAGKPLAVKEIFAVEGVPTTANSRLDTDSAATHDCPAVARLRSAGWTPVATTRTHEWAWGITGTRPDGSGVQNPHDPTRIAGGSSGGSAVVVATGATDLAVGSDTGGSVRIPAAFCGVLGLKVTHGAVPMEGVLPLVPSMDSAGLLARDLATLREGLQAWGVSVETSAPVRIAAGVLPGAPPLRADLAQLVGGALGRLGLRGEGVLPAADQGYRLYPLVQAPEALAAHAASWPSRRDEYGADVAARLEAAARLPLPPDLAAQRAAYREGVLAAFADCDVLALPMAACGPSRTASRDVVDGAPLRDLVLPFTVPANLAGLPAMSVPVGVDRDGLPVAVQLLAVPGGEAGLLAAAAVLLR